MCKLDKKGVPGDEKTSSLAKQGSFKPFMGPEPVFGTTRTQVRGRLDTSHIENGFNGYMGVRAKSQQAHATRPLKALEAKILKLSRNQVRTVTGHSHLRKHLHTNTQRAFTMMNPSLDFAVKRKKQLIA